MQEFTKKPDKFPFNILPVKNSNLHQTVHTTLPLPQMQRPLGASFEQLRSTLQSFTKCKPMVPDVCSAPVELVMQEGNVMKSQHIEQDFSNLSTCTTGQMSSLHAKLFQEAQKICKWKMTMEFELRQRGDREKDQKWTIDTQRQSLLNLQFDNENLSLKMEEEIHKQKELKEMNTNTRELCNAVKNHCTKVTASVKKTQIQCEETKQVYRTIKAQVEKLQDEFSNLHITTQQTAKDMISKLEGERQEKEKFQEMHKYEMLEKSQEFEELWKKASQQEEELNSTASQLQTYEEKCSQLRDMKEKLQQLLEEAMCKVQSVNAHLAETKAALESTKAEKDKIEGDLVAAHMALEKVMREKEEELFMFDQKEKSLQLQQKQLESTKIDLEEKLSDCMKNLEDLKNVYADLLTCSQQFTKEHDKLKKENDLQKSELDDALAKKQCLLEELQECMANRDSARKETTSLLTNLDAEREKAKALSEQCAHLQLKKDELHEQIDLAHNQVNKIEHLLEDSKHNEVAAREETEKMKEMLEQKIREFEKQNQKREEELSHEKAVCEQSKQTQLQIVEQKVSFTLIVLPFQWFSCSECILVYGHDRTVHPIIPCVN
uniref:Synaptonemal complex protein 1 n=1 Tax=Eptatretus burgeri TaxID=7764 RepID=A0A8C4QKN3_EPTBU